MAPTARARSLKTLSATPATVNANGDYTSQASTRAPRGAGTYRWIAHFAATPTTKPSSGECSDPGEITEVDQASPGAGRRTTTVYGDRRRDDHRRRDALQTGQPDRDRRRQLRHLQRARDCSGASLKTLSATPATVNANGDYTSAGFDTTATGAGTYRWIAHYSRRRQQQSRRRPMHRPQRDHRSRQSHPGVHQSDATATVGESDHRRRDALGAGHPTAPGAVTFDIYKGADCSGASLETLTRPPPRSTPTATTPRRTSTRPPGAGTYRWIAHYAGDANNKAVDGKCSDPNETTEVEKASPGLVTKATTTATVGENHQRRRDALRTGQPDRPGAVTFDIYKGADCSGASLNGDPDRATPATVDATATTPRPTSTPTATGAGTYHWIAHLLRRRQQQSRRRRLPGPGREPRPSTRPRR